MMQRASKSVPHSMESLTMKYDIQTRRTATPNGWNLRLQVLEQDCLAPGTCLDVRASVTLAIDNKAKCITVGRDETFFFSAHDLGPAQDEADAATLAVDQLLLSVGPRMTPNESALIRRYCMAVIVASLALVEAVPQNVRLSA